MLDIEQALGLGAVQIDLTALRIGIDDPGIEAAIAHKALGGGILAQGLGEQLDGAAIGVGAQIAGIAGAAVHIDRADGGGGEVRNVVVGGAVGVAERDVIILHGEIAVGQAA